MSSIQDYEEYPTACCWIPHCCRFCETTLSDSEESPELTKLIARFEEAERERETQAKRPLCQKRVYLCCSMRVWQVLLIVILLIAISITIIVTHIIMIESVREEMKKLETVKKELEFVEKNLDMKINELQHAEEKLKEINEYLKQRENDLLEVGWLTEYLFFSFPDHQILLIDDLAKLDKSI